MQLNKRKLFFSFFLLFANITFAEVVNFFTPDFSWKIENGISLQNGNDFSSNTIAMDFYNELNMNELILSSGIENSQEGFHFTTEAVYWPTIFRYFNVGVGSSFHVYVRDKEFVEIDLLSGIFIRYSNLDWFEFKGNCSFFEKLSKIYAIEDSVPWLENKNLALSMEFNFTPYDWLEAYLEIGSYEYYRYMLWFAPNVRIGFSIKVSPLIKIGSEIDFQYIDMFTLSSNCNSIDVRGFLRFLF